MSDDDQQTPRAGTYADLSRRMDRMEVRHDDLAKDVSAITSTVSQVVQNQNHAEELNELRFKSLDTAVGQLTADLKGFMARIEGIMTGEVQTAATRQGAEMVEEYKEWRASTDKRLAIIEDVPTLLARVDVLEEREMRRKGVLEAFSGVKGILLMLAAIASPLIAAAGIILTRPPG